MTGNRLRAEFRIKCKDCRTVFRVEGMRLSAERAKGPCPICRSERVMEREKVELGSGTYAKRFGHYRARTFQK